MHSEPYLFTGTFIHSSGTRVTLSHLLIAGKRSTTYSEGGRGALRIALTHYKRCPKKDVLAIPTQHSASVQGSSAQTLLEFPTQNPGAQVTLLHVRLPEGRESKSETLRYIVRYIGNGHPPGQRMTEVRKRDEGQRHGMHS